MKTCTPLASGENIKMSLSNAALAQQANFVQFAYNMYALGGLRPAPDKGLAACGYKLLYWLNAKDLGASSFYGYLAVSATNPGEVIIAIRGTEDVREWLLDFAAIPVHMSGIGFVALGFLCIFNTFVFVDSTGASFSLLAVITKLAAAHPIQSLNIAGHSLGAALSSLASVQLATTNPAGVASKISSFTFASPRVGLLDFASHFNNTVSTSYRVWNSLDIVPDVPTFPYIHVSGKGDELVQTREQLSRLAYSPSCEHHLSSYLWLLDPANFQLDPGCALSAVHSMMCSAAGVSDDHSAGIEALLIGAHGRL
jgi:hypothetical protein